jgi:hypothetical protein
MDWQRSELTAGLTAKVTPLVRYREVARNPR